MLNLPKSLSKLLNSVKAVKANYSWLVGWLEFNIPCQHKYGYITDER